MSDSILIQELGGGTQLNSLRKNLQNVMACCDGQSDLIAIAEALELYMGELLPVVEILKNHELITEV